MEATIQLYAPTVSSPERGPGTHPIGGWLGPAAGLEAVEWIKSLAYAENRKTVLPPVTRSCLYSLSYPAYLDSLHTTTPYVFMA
jgi:hypothetical protein